MKETEFERTYHRNGCVFQEVPFVAGKINGVIREWHRNGVLAREVPMKDGVRHGACKQWNDKGDLLGTFQMTMGTGVSKQWFRNGQLEFEASIVTERFSGRLRRWDEAGRLVQETFFLENKAVPRVEYDRARRSDPALPSYSEETGETSAAIAPGGSRRRGHERLIARLLSTRTENAAHWLQSETVESTRTLGELSTAKSNALVKSLLHAGAVEVLAADIDEDRKGNEHADKIIIVLPADRAERQAIRRLCARKKFEVSPETETGDAHLAVFLG